MPPMLCDRRSSFYPRQCGLHLAAREVNLRDTVLQQCPYLRQTLDG